MKILLGTICVCLLVILCVLLWKYISLKRNIRRFSRELEKLKDDDYRLAYTSYKKKWYVRTTIGGHV